MHTDATVRLSRAHVLEWSAATAVGAALIALAAFWPVRVSSGYWDQELYHWPTAAKFAEEFPNPNFLEMQTATGPVYHLLAASVHWFGASMALTQFLVGLFCWSLASGVIIYELRGVERAYRYLVLVAVLASPYVLQGTLWMTTDALSLALSLLTLSLLLRIPQKQEGFWRAVVVCGILIALTCAVRQTAIWLAFVAIAVVLLARSDLKQRLAVLAVILAPVGVTLLALVFVWGGLTPPSAREANGSGAEPLGLPVGFALWAFFAAPLLLAVWKQIPVRGGVVGGATLSGLACAAPAVIWTSTYNFPDRMGGWPWQVFRAVGGVLDRSPALILLAFVGGAAVFLLLRTIAAAGSKQQAWILGVAIYTSILVSTASSFALPRYREIPLLVCFPFVVAAVRALTVAKLDRRRLLALLTLPALLQVLASLLIVGIPVVRYLMDPSSVPPPEWVQLL